MEPGLKGWVALAKYLRRRRGFQRGGSMDNYLGAKKGVTDGL